MDHLDALVGYPAKEPEKRASGNPYPKRGQIKEKVVLDMYKWVIESPCFLSRLLSLALELEEEAAAVSDDDPRRKAKGNPYPRRGQIKEKILEDIFKLIPEAITG